MLEILTVVSVAFVLLIFAAHWIARGVPTHPD
jgi:hypothetical protein